MHFNKIREINRFSPRVYYAVKKLLAQLGADPERLTEEHFREIIKSRSSHLFIAELENNEIAGMLSIGTYPIPSGTKIWIEDVVVDELHRGKRIGEELTLYAIEFARKSGASSVDLTSRPTRKAANKLYQKLGFEPRQTNVYRYEFDKTELIR